MQKQTRWILIGSPIAIALSTLAFLPILLHTDQVIKTQQFMTKEEMIKLLAKRYPYIESSGIDPEFGFLEYNGTLSEGLIRFMVYQADPYSGTFIQKEDSVIFYEGQYGPIVFSKSEYMSDKVTDRFVWILFGPPLPQSDQYYVDASTGELIGILHAGAYCHGCKEGK